MSSALKRLPVMTVEAFLDWADATPGLWQLRDGQPEAMSPPAESHAAIVSYLAYLLTGHLERTGSRCRVLVGPGVVPRLRSEHNMLVPDIAVTCAPPTGGRSVTEPVVLVEVLSPSNVRQTRANVWAFATIPSVRELVVLDSRRIEGEVMRRAADDSWPERPEPLGREDELRIEAVGFAAPLRDAYRTSVLG